MVTNSRWWKKQSEKHPCESCGREEYCFKWRGKEASPCGFTKLCEGCYEKIVHAVYTAPVKKRKFLSRLCISILGVCIGAAGVYTYYNLHELLPETHPINNHITIVTEDERKILTDWAMEKAKNVSAQVVRQMVDAACESEFPRLVMAIIGAETLPKFDPGSISNKGCWGPMQVDPDVWEKKLIEEGIIKTRTDLFDPTLGVRSGIYVFKDGLVQTKGNLRSATWRYVGYKRNKKDAEKYFECIQLYLGEIYLALHKAGENNHQEGNEVK